MLGLINDILDLSKIEAGRYELKKSIVELAPFLEGSSELASIQARQNGVRFDVTLPDGFPDQGIGMTPDDIQEVLEPFSQADSSKARRYEGTGLGLHICLKFMQLHGGSLEIDSEIRVGTTVTIRFPAERVMPATMPIKRISALSQLTAKTA